MSNIEKAAQAVHQALREHGDKVSYNRVLQAMSKALEGMCYQAVKALGPSEEASRQPAQPAVYMLPSGIEKLRQARSSVTSTSAWGSPGSFAGEEFVPLFLHPPAQQPAPGSSTQAHFVVSGRVPGDDEDVTMVLELPASASRGDAEEAFEAKLYGLLAVGRLQTPQQYREEVRAEHGTTIYVNSVLRSDAPIVEVAHYPGSSQAPEPASDGSAVVIFSPSEFWAGDGAGFWSNEDGWTVLRGATRFDPRETAGLNLPITPGADARWVTLEEGAALQGIDSSTLQAAKLLREHGFEDGERSREQFKTYERLLAELISQVGSQWGLLDTTERGQVRGAFTFEGVLGYRAAWNDGRLESEDGSSVDFDAYDAQTKEDFDRALKSLMLVKLPTR